MSDEKNGNVLLNLFTLQRKRFPSVYVLIIFCVIGFIIYSNAIRHPFVHDEVIYIENNPQIGEYSPGDILKPSKINDKGPKFRSKYYRPVLDVFYYIQWRLFGLDPHVFHFSNILIHILNAWLFYLLACKVFEGMGKAPNSTAFFTAFVFLVHPIQSEAVACVSGISNLIFTFFVLLSANLFLSAQLLGAILCFVLALLSKEHAIVFPVISVLLVFLLPFKAHKKRLYFIGGYFAAALGYLFVRKMVLGGGVVEIDAYFVRELFIRLLAVPKTILTYLRLIVLPYDLHYYRNLDILDHRFYLYFSVFSSLAIAAVLCLRFLRNKKIALLGLLWFAVSILPVINIIPLVNEYSFVFIGEHFLYFPAIGLLIFGGVVLFEISKKNRKSSAAVKLILVCVCVLFAGTTIFLNTFWKSEIALFERMVEYEEDFGRGRMLLAKAYFDAGRFQDAIRENKKAEAIMKGYLNKVKGSSEHEKIYSYFLERIYLITGDCFAALKEYRRAIRHYDLALEINPQNAVTLDHKGVGYILLGEWDLALEALTASSGSNPGLSRTWNSMGLCLIKLGRFQEAEDALKEAVKLDPGDLSAKQNLEALLKIKNIK